LFYLIEKKVIVYGIAAFFIKITSTLFYKIKKV
jgi:hypothetical protein